jgi:indole-3-acetate monooxygenase
MVAMTTIEVPTADHDSADLVAIARSLEPLIRAHEADFERDRSLPADVVDALYESGVFRAFTPAELGGLEVNPLEWLGMVEELSRISGAVGWVAMVNAGMIPMKPDVFKDYTEGNRWIGAMNAGRMAGKARRVEGGYLVSGTWPFTSGSPYATYLGGMTALYDDNDMMVLHPRDHQPWIVNCVFARDQVEIHNDWDGLGVRGTGSGHFTAKDVFVPEAIADQSMREKPYSGPLYRCFHFLFMAHCAQAIGLAVAMYDEFIALCNGAKAHGSRRQMELGQLESQHIVVARADATIRACRLLTRDVVARAWNEVNSEAQTTTVDTRVEMFEAIIYVTQTCRGVVDQLFRAAGTSGVMKRSPLERIFRDMMTIAQHILTTEDRYSELGMYLLTKDTDMPLVPMMAEFS